MHCKHCGNILTHVLTTLEGERIARCNGVNTSLQGLEHSRRAGFTACHAIYKDGKELADKVALAYSSGGGVQAVFVKELRGR